MNRRKPQFSFGKLMKEKQSEIRGRSYNQKRKTRKGKEGNNAEVKGKT